MFEILIAIALVLLFAGTLWRLYSVRRKHSRLKDWAEVGGVLYLMYTGLLLFAAFYIAPPFGVTGLRAATMSILPVMFALMSFLILLGPSYKLSQLDS